MFVSQEMAKIWTTFIQSSFFAASKIEAALSLQIEAGGKIMGAHKYLGQNLLKSVQKLFLMDNPYYAIMVSLKLHRMFYICFQQPVT